jgi:tRNA (cmo5U34)-methyltransferase
MKKEIPRYIGPDISAENRKLSREEIKNRFDNEVAELYSQRDPAWMPDFEEIFSLVPEILSRHIQAEGKTLDIGAGTGNLTRTVLEKMPDHFITMTDFSENMLGYAPYVLKDFPDRYETIAIDFFEMEFNENSFDGAISSFAIHHARGEGQFLKLYKDIYSWLKPQGVFVCCDVVDGNSAVLSLLNEENWLSFLGDSGFEIGDVEKILSNYHREDSPISLTRHLDLLRTAGFGTVDVVWKRYNFAVYVGVKDS